MFQNGTKSKIRRLSKAFGVMWRKFSTSSKTMTNETLKKRNSKPNDSILSRFDVRSIYNSIVYIESCIDQGNENDVNRLYHPQRHHVNSSRENQVLLCQLMIQGEFDRVDHFALFSDVHVVAEAVKLVLKQFVALEPSSLYGALRTASKLKDFHLIISAHGILANWKNYSLFLHIIHHLARLCKTKDTSLQNDEIVLGKVFDSIFFPELDKSEQRHIVSHLIHYINECSGSSGQDMCGTLPNELNVNQECSQWKESELDPRIVAFFKNHLQIMTKAKEQLCSAQDMLQKVTLVLEK